MVQIRAHRRGLGGFPGYENPSAEMLFQGPLARISYPIDLSQPGERGSAILIVNGDICRPFGERVWQPYRSNLQRSFS